jgi:hypothetical protein
VGLAGCLYSKKRKQKNGSEHAASEPLLIFTALVDLLVAYPLTRLLIGSPHELPERIQTIENNWDAAQ